MEIPYVLMQFIPFFPERTPDGMPPVFTIPLRDMTCMDGDKVVFECKVSGYPVPDVIWTRGGQEIKPSGDFDIKFDGETAALKINGVYPEDTGEYTCVARNEVGEEVSTGQLLVKGRMIQKI